MPDDLAGCYESFQMQMRKATYKCSKCGLEGRGDPSDFFANEEVEHYLEGCEGALRPYTQPYDPALGQLVCSQPEMFTQICGVEGYVPLPSFDPDLCRKPIRK